MRSPQTKLRHYPTFQWLDYCIMIAQGIATVLSENDGSCGSFLTGAENPGAQKAEGPESLVEILVPGGFVAWANANGVLVRQLTQVAGRRRQEDLQRSYAADGGAGGRSGRGSDGATG